MLADPRVRQFLRSTDQRLPPQLRRTLRLVTRRSPFLRSTPLVTVVVAGRAGRSAGLGKCLDTLRAQEHRNTEILVALDDHSSPDAALVRRHVAEDWRIRLLRTPAASPAEGRNQGAAEARGSYLTFLRPEDTLPVTALRRAVRSLEETGSDFAFGRLSEVGGLHRTVTTVTHPAHESTREAVSLHDFPAAVTDTFDENRVYRTDFWRQAALVFPVTAGPTPALRAFARARTFDVLAETTYLRSARGAGRPIGSLISAMADLDDWLATQAVMESFLSQGGVDELRQAWAFAVCDIEVVALLDDAERATPQQWDALRSFLASVRQEMTAESWSSVRAESRVKVWLAVEGHRTALEQFTVQRLFEHGNRRTEVVAGQVMARFDGLAALDEAGVRIPEDCLVMTDRETPLQVHLHSARWLDGSHLELVAHVFATFVGYPDPADDMADGAGDRLSVALVDGRRQRRVELPVERFTDPEVNLTGGHRYQDYSAGGVRVVVDAGTLPGPPEPPEQPEQPERWSLEVELTTSGVTRSGTVNSREDRTTAGLLDQSAHAPRLVSTAGGHRSVSLRPEARRGVALTVGAAPQVVAVQVGAEGRIFTGVLRGVPSGATLIATGPAGLQASCPVQAEPDGTASYRLELPRPRAGSPADVEIPPPAAAGQPDAPTPPTARRWGVRLVTADGELSIGFPPHAPGRFHPDPAGSPAGAELVVGRGVRGYVEVWETVRSLVLTSVELAEGRVLLRGRWLGAAPGSWRLAMRTRRASVEVSGRSSAGAGNRFEAALPTVWDEWGLGESCIPTGAYQVEVSAEPTTVLGPSAPRPGDTDVRLLLGEELLPELMASQRNTDFRMTSMRNGRGLVVRLSPPLAADERGPYAQRVLQEWSSGDELELDPSAVYLQSYTGTSATDSQRALHDELRRSRPDLTLHWAVDSSATVIPEGGVRLLIHSREWYRVLGSAKYLCNNIDFDRWFTRKPEQRYLQTFHGYPAKSMGIRLWKAKQFTPQRIQVELGRTSRDWTLILTPTPAMDQYYRTEYAYRGEIENRGYPRDDALLAPDAEEVRDRTRRLLGIAPHQTAVLYAPTWRDDQATNYRSAVMTRHLDLESATARLGAEYVFLMRGHRFHTKVSERGSRTARLVEVTDYPEINDLILAADAAVLDYSSLRFDFALTGRPMLFLVPDLSSYTGGVRGFLYPFEESAPGPLLSDAEDVVAALRRLPQLTSEYAEAYAAFNRSYNHLQDGQAARRVVERFFT